MPRTVFVIGAPRSGTTWLQRLLGSHDLVVTTQETALFDEYLAGWDRLWEEHSHHGANDRYRGLPAVLTSQEFDAIIRDVLVGVYSKALSLKPSASVVVDKTPGHATVVDRIAQLMPDSQFIHIIRDGRDVTASLVRAHRTWGSRWAPRRIDAAAEVWARHIDVARSAALPNSAYLEVRYEDLLGGRRDVLYTCLDFLGLPDALGAAATIVEQATQTEVGVAWRDPIRWSGEVAARLGHPPEEPPGFYGTGAHGSWSHEWGKWDRWSFDSVAGDLLIDLGYENSHGWASVPPLLEHVYRSSRHGRELYFRIRSEIGRTMLFGLRSRRPQLLAQGEEPIVGRVP